MYIYIQWHEITRKVDGFPKFLELSSRVSGNWCVNTYNFSDVCYKRGERFNFYITLRKSFRDHNKVQQQIMYVATLKYDSVIGSYDILNDQIDYSNIMHDILRHFKQVITCLYDGNVLSCKYNKSIDAELYLDLENKVSRATESIVQHFKSTEEYQVHKKNLEILQEHRKRCIAFTKQYKCLAEEYDICYDVRGCLTNPEYLKILQIKEKTKVNLEVYSEEEQIFLKQFYKTLCKKYHPDLNKSEYANEQMHLISKLKRDWNV